MNSRIPQAEIDRIVSAVDIVDVIGSRVKLKTSGRDKVALCPFHDENTPSFTVTPSKQVYFCFGCGAAGDAMEFIQEYEGRSFLECLEILADMAGLPVPKADRRPSAIDSLVEAGEFYRRALWAENPGAAAARAYLAERGISEATAKAFGLGYAAPGGRVLANAMKPKLRDLIQLGVVDQTEGRAPRDRFRERLVIPVRTAGGQEVGMTARTLCGEEPKYINSQVSEWFKKDRLIFGLDQAKKGVRAGASGRIDRLYVVEGQTDVMTSHAAGEPRLVAVLGRSINAVQVRSLLAVADTVVFTFDGDRAGEEAMRSTFEMLLGILADAGRVRFKRLPAGEDPSSLIQKRGLAAFYETSEQGFLETLVEYLPAGDDDDALLARAEAGIAFIQQIKDSVLRGAAIRAVARAAELPVDALAGRLQHNDEPAKAPRRAPPPLLGQGAARMPTAAIWRSLMEAPGLLTTLVWPEFAREQAPKEVLALVDLSEMHQQQNLEPSHRAIANAIGELEDATFVREIHALPAAANAEAELQEAFTVLVRHLARTLAESYLARVRAGVKLSQDEQTRYFQLIAY